MNCKEVLQIYGPTFSHLSDKELFKKMADLCYKQINHGVSWEYWKKSYGSRGYIKPENIREHIKNAVAEKGQYSEVAMAVGLKRYRERKQAEAEARAYSVR